MFKGKTAEWTAGADPGVCGWKTADDRESARRDQRGRQGTRNAGLRETGYRVGICLQEATGVFGAKGLRDLI